MPRSRMWASSTAKPWPPRCTACRSSADKHPGVLMDMAFDDKGDIDRESYIVEVNDGKQVVKEVLPALNAKK